MFDNVTIPNSNIYVAYNFYYVLYVYFEKSAVQRNSSTLGQGFKRIVFLAFLTFSLEKILLFYYFYC